MGLMFTHNMQLPELRGRLPRPEPKPAGRWLLASRGCKVQTQHVQSQRRFTALLHHLQLLLLLHLPPLPCPLQVVLRDCVQQHVGLAVPSPQHAQA